MSLLVTAEREQDTPAGPIQSCVFKKRPIFLSLFCCQMGTVFEFKV